MSVIEPHAVEFQPFLARDMPDPLDPGDGSIREQDALAGPNIRPISPGFSYYEAATGQPIAAAIARLLAVRN
jgi:hypothetical protein